VIISGAVRIQAVNFSEANNLAAKWDGNVFRVPNTAFYPFVQQLKSMYIVLLAVKSPSDPNTVLAVKGYFSVETNTVTNFYIEDGPNTSPYTLKAGTTVYIASTQPYSINQGEFVGYEIYLLESSYTIPADNLLTLEKVYFTNTSAADAYVFLTTRNTDDTFGFVGWRIPTSDPRATYLLNDQNRLLTNVTVNFVQLVSAAKTKLKMTIRNYGYRDSSINYVLISGFPAGLISSGYSVRPFGTCTVADSNATTIKCLVDFIPAKSFFKFSIVFPQRFITPLTLHASGDNFVPRDVVARLVMNTRSRGPRTPTRSTSPRPT